MPIMHSLIVTGGIATGKSSFCRSWIEMEPDTVFHDSDVVVHELYADPMIRLEVSVLFGPQVLTGTHDIDRAHIRREIFEKPEKKRKLEAIIHPKVRQRCQESFGKAAKEKKTWFIADIPLFFEAGCWKPTPETLVVVVACSPETQMNRLLARNPFDKQEAKRIIDAQADLSAKMAAADHVVWNDGTPTSLSRQSKLLSSSLLAGK